jgi:3-hydroxymyristoyl/3-hydroxydecanoyl-(acyl carrier protein) dehydratase
MAFHLVTRILSVEDARAARGLFRVPASGPPLSPCLVAEAIGQLAAWVAMARFDFRLRPVAGIAGDVEFSAHVSPGASVDLAVDIDRLDETAIAYGGSASLAGSPLLTMRGCVGPMMSMNEFEDPEAARARFARISETGEIGIESVPESPPLELAAGKAGKQRSALLRVPSDAPYFADHFPLRPVFPGTLLLDAQVRLAETLAGEAVPEADRPRLVPRRARGVKFRAFLAPGDVVKIEGTVVAVDASGVRIRLAARKDDQRAGDSRIEVSLDGDR